MKSMNLDQIIFSFIITDADGSNPPVELIGSFRENHQRFFYVKAENE